MSIKACVLGSPAGHSLSPALHGHWLKRYKIDGSYVAMETPAAALRETLEDLLQAGFAGCNLTLPLKEAALDMMDALGPAAKEARAVNTVIMKDGRMTGLNSDGFGFIASLNAQAPAWNKRHAAILGAGGAARGIVAALKKAGIEKFSFICRTPEHAGKIMRDLDLNADIASAPPPETGLLVNCTPCGMAGRPPLDLDISALPPDATVCDIVYSPLETPLLAAARKRGLLTAAGLPMLLHQGRIGFKHWFGTDPAVTPALEEEIAACLK